ncbi:hypothetical protein IZ6_23530 [Terrihabitans soli]|uniref:Activator of Hsp90 ATPase homologue 1/2-like C-terminal domain-containing protein n=1 Tax=Terrihabitans soli TaxID=708113 RepID=A0A6S6QYG2_9HYPH|nr:SRPBCC family protein [Terrihabitans soli]BCJ91618.1 hypothetical protein IZ6_23530 [Terrihabitans soli]
MRDFAVETASDTIRFERHMPGPISRIWDFLTHPTIRGRWLATGPMDLKEGGSYEMIFRHDELTPHPGIAPPGKDSPKGFTVRGEVLESRFPSVLALTWPDAGPDSKVTFVLTSLHGQVRVTLIHSGIRDRATLAELAAGWHAHLNVLEAKANSVTPPPFWKRFAEYHEEYIKKFAS